MTTRPTLGSIDSLGIPMGVPMLFAFDPGKSTGWAMWSLKPDRPWLSFGQGESAEVLRGFRHLLCRMGPWAVTDSKMVVERFTVPSRPTGSSNDIAAAFEVIGVLKFLASLNQMPPPKMQLPVERNITSKKLMIEWGWLRTPLQGRDATSAVQHLGAYLLKNNAVPRLPSVVG